MKTERKTGEHCCTKCKQYTKERNSWRGGLYCNSCYKDILKRHKG